MFITLHRSDSLRRMKTPGSTDVDKIDILSFTDLLPLLRSLVRLRLMWSLCKQFLSQLQTFGIKIYDSPNIHSLDTMQTTKSSHPPATNSKTRYPHLSNACSCLPHPMPTLSTP